MALLTQNSYKKLAKKNAINREHAQSKPNARAMETLNNDDAAGYLLSFVDNRGYLNLRPCSKRVKLMCDNFVDARQFTPAVSAGWDKEERVGDWPCFRFKYRNMAIFARQVREHAHVIEPFATRLVKLGDKSVLCDRVCLDTASEDIAWESLLGTRPNDLPCALSLVKHIQVNRFKKSLKNYQYLWELLRDLRDMHHPKFLSVRYDSDLERFSPQRLSKMHVIVDWYAGDENRVPRLDSGQVLHVVEQCPHPYVDVTLESANIHVDEFRYYESLFTSTRLLPSTRVWLNPPVPIGFLVVRPKRLWIYCIVPIVEFIRESPVQCDLSDVTAINIYCSEGEQNCFWLDADAFHENVIQGYKEGENLLEVCTLNGPGQFEVFSNLKNLVLTTGPGETNEEGAFTIEIVNFARPLVQGMAT